MRKGFLLVLLVCAALLCLACAGAETVTLDSIHAKVDVPEDFVLLTPDNLERHTEWIANHNTTQEAILSDMEDRGVLLQAWSQGNDVRFEITAVQDNAAESFFDLDQQATKTRNQYADSILRATAGGYKYQSADWKNSTNAGRFLLIRYKQTVNGGEQRGYMRRTIRNGYTISLDYRVMSRTLKTADNTALTAIFKTFSFTQVLEKPATSVVKVTMTQEPPTETNTGKFKVAGTCEPGLTLCGVVMRMSSPDPVRVETTAGKNGKFSMDVTLPSEGVWLMTMTAYNGDAEVQELVFSTTTYQSTLLPVNFDSDVPMLFSEDTQDIPTSDVKGDVMILSGTTMKQTEIQCFTGNDLFKQVKTNNSGTFKFKIPLNKLSDTDIVVVFSKKGYNTRRFIGHMTHNITAGEIIAEAKKNAVKPAYQNLTSKITGYTGKVMVYSLYAVEITEREDGKWQLLMAMKQKQSGLYSQYVVVVCDERPNFTADSLQRMYATCTGSVEYTHRDGTTGTYPAFELIIWE